MEVLKSTILVTYFSILTVLSIYGAHRLWMLLLYYRHKKEVPQPKGDAGYLPMVTVQLAIFNEMNVVERLVDYVTAMDWPKEKLEIQLLDDSTDETVHVAEAV
ncbi:MAG: glycosyl transferase family 2, partial [Acidobacteriota bacterium]|nr:glycosyl transferase family 2 [Acidobacteriota bacterium]